MSHGPGLRILDSGKVQYEGRGKKHSITGLILLEVFCLPSEFYLSPHDKRGGHITKYTESPLIECELEVRPLNSEDTKLSFLWVMTVYKDQHCFLSNSTSSSDLLFGPTSYVSSSPPDISSYSTKQFNWLLDLYMSKSELTNFVPQTQRTIYLSAQARSKANMLHPFSKSSVLKKKKKKHLIDFISWVPWVVVTDILQSCSQVLLPRLQQVVSAKHNSLIPPHALQSIIPTAAQAIILKWKSHHVYLLKPFNYLS